MIATLPAQHVARQVTRVAAHTGLDPAIVTGEVADALSRGAEAGGDLGRPARRDRRDDPVDLDRGPAETVAPTAIQLARAGYPAAAGRPSQSARITAESTPARPHPDVGRARGRPPPVIHRSIQDVTGCAAAPVTIAPQTN